MCLCVNGLMVCVFSNKVVHYIFIEEHRKHNMEKKWDTCTSLLKISVKDCTPLSLQLQMTEITSMINIIVYQPISINSLQGCF